jgi:hypothetical protein
MNMESCGILCPPNCLGEECNLSRHFKIDQQCINMLKIARFKFDRVYPDGMKCVPNLAPLPQIRNRSQPRRAVAPTAAAAKTGRTCDAVVLHEIQHCQCIADMRMAPINNQIGTPARTNQLLQFDCLMTKILSEKTPLDRHRKTMIRRDRLCLPHGGRRSSRLLAKLNLQS